MVKQTLGLEGKYEATEKQRKSEGRHKIHALKQTITLGAMMQETNNSTSQPGDPSCNGIMGTSYDVGQVICYVPQCVPSCIAPAVSQPSINCVTA